MKKLAASILLLGLLSTSQAEDTYYIPIPSLEPISYNPLTTNYNPSYDYYPGLMAMQSQGSNQADSGSSPTNARSSQVAGLESRIAQLKQDRDAKTKQVFNSSLGESLTLSVQVRQLNTEIQNLEDRLTTLTTGQAPMRIVNQAAPRRSINCYTYGLGNAFTTCN
ncbi:hypothetical protein [Achromobacter insolitus]|uniref:hypothetical protein n=1 Tax=Achromobacter insolitus TaxID=217204 RepID=UPI0020A5881E|nr:hypothetical protein [Achromobacter insolitus]MCP1401844.1 outer membrane murein-binding lipoprotein Lpp [Achromobacter insolitus]